MSIRSIFMIMALPCLFFIRESVALDNAAFEEFGKCTKDAQKYLAQKQYDEYQAALEKCKEVFDKNLEKTGIKILESASSLSEALKKPERIGTLGINLYSQKIERLPDEFVKLQNLEELSIVGINARDYFGMHRFDIGDAMNKITKIPKIRKLILEGDLKAEDIKDRLKNLRQLKMLKLTGMHEIPAEIGDLVNLEQLYIEGKEISSVPPVIGNLGKLTNLAITGTSVSSLPAEIGRLRNLLSLNVSKNKLVSIPPSMRDLTGLKDFEVWGNPVADQRQWEEIL